jgi:hypothetical protein
VVAGASEGLGAAFAEEAARRGLHLALAARRAERLEELCACLSGRFGVECRPFALDLAEAPAAEALDRGTRDLVVGLLVVNAALSLLGPFLEHPLE